MLIGRIYDDRGNRMSPSHARKAGIKYRYYVSSRLMAAGVARSISRVPATEVEALVGSPSASISSIPRKVMTKDLYLCNHVIRVEVASRPAGD